MEETAQDRTRAESGAPRRGLAFGGRRVAVALALAALACLMLAHWLTYSVERVTTDPAYIEVIPPTAALPPAGSASLPARRTPADAARQANEPARNTLFTHASFSSSSDAATGPETRRPEGVGDAARQAPSAQSSPTPSQPAQTSRPNFVRRFFRWVSGLFGGSKPRPNSPPVISAVSLSADKVVLNSPCPPEFPRAAPCPSRGSSVSLVVSANDPDGDTLTYEFRPSAGRVSRGRAGDPHATWDVDGVGMGTYELSVVALERAPDSDRVVGRSEPFRVKLFVVECPCRLQGIPPTACPAASIEGPEVTSVRRRFPLRLKGADSPTGAAASDFRWTLSAGAVSRGQGTPEVEVDPAGLEPGIVNARVNFRVAGLDCAASTDVRVDVPRDGGTALRGKVLDQHGKPLARILVKALRGGDVVGEAQTLDDGSFALRAPHGSYRLVAVAPDGSLQVMSYEFRSGGASAVFPFSVATATNTNAVTPPTTTTTPRPGESPTPTPSTSPTPTPTPTPTPSASPTPANLKRVGQDRITVARPERFLEGQTETVTCELAMVEKYVVASETFEHGVATVIDKPGPVAGAVNPELARAFGETYTSHARFVLESDDLDFSLDYEPERPVPAEVGQRAEWVWKARLKVGARETVSYRLRLDVVWRPKTGGGEEIVRRGVWEREFRDVPTGLPLTVRASKYGSGAVGLAALGAFVVPGRRKRLDELEAELGDGTPPAPAAPPAPPTPEAAADEVLCTVYARREARPGDALLVQAFAHLAAHADALAARARKSDEAAEERGSETLESPVERGSRLTFTLQMPGLEIDEPSQSFVWKGDAKLVQFGVAVPADCPTKSVVGKLTVCQESVPVGHVRFTLNVVAAAAASAPAATAVPPKGEQPAGEFVRYRQAFISYCSKDRAEVLRRVQMLRLVRLNFHQDLLELEPGQEWEPQLYKWIDESDVFFLFWSRAAKESPWVEKELQYALRRKGERDESPPEIVPVILEGPPPVAPPPYLSARHFNDTFLYFLRVEDQLKAAAARGPQPAPPPPETGAA